MERSRGIDVEKVKSGNHPGGHLVPRIWVLVADGHRMRAFRKTSGQLELVAEARPSPSRRAGRIPDDAMGRVGSSAGGTIRHKLEPRMDEGRKAVRSFAEDIAAWLDGAVAENAFDRLVLAAAPKMLGELRRVIAAPVQARIVAEVSKDLTKMDERALAAELEKVVWF